MRILLYGASGAAGRRIAAEAVARGHELTAVTRSGTAVPGAEASLSGDFTDFDGYSQLVVDHDAVVFAIGPFHENGSYDRFLETHRHIARSMAPARVVVVGYAGSAADAQAAMDAVHEAYLSAENLDWTMPVPGAGVSAETFAAAVLDELEDYAHRNEAFGVPA